MRRVAPLILALVASAAGANAPALGRYDGQFCVTVASDSAASCGPAEVDVLRGRELRVRISDIVYRLKLNSSQVEVVLMHGTIQDITERRFAEAALRESHETLTSILATTKDGFWRVDRQGRLIDANPAYSQLSGYRHDELVGRHIATFETATAAEIAAHIARVIESGGEQFEAVHRRQDGSLWNVEVSAIFEDTHGSYGVRCNAGSQIAIWLKSIVEFDLHWIGKSCTACSQRVDLQKSFKRSHVLPVV